MQANARPAGDLPTDHDVRAKQRSLLAHVAGARLVLYRRGLPHLLPDRHMRLLRCVRGH